MSLQFADILKTFRRGNTKTTEPVLPPPPPPTILDLPLRAQISSVSLSGRYALVDESNPLANLTGWDNARNQRIALGKLLWKLGLTKGIAEVGRGGRQMARKAANDAKVRKYISLSKSAEELIFPSGAVYGQYSGNIFDIRNFPYETGIGCVLFWGSWETRGLSEFNFSIQRFSDRKTWSEADADALCSARAVLDEGGHILIVSSRFATTPVPLDTGPHYYAREHDYMSSLADRAETLIGSHASILFGSTVGKVTEEISKWIEDAEQSLLYLEDRIPRPRLRFRTISYHAHSDHQLLRDNISRWSALQKRLAQTDPKLIYRVDGLAISV